MKTWRSVGRKSAKTERVLSLRQQNELNQLYGLRVGKHCQVLGPGTKHVMNAHIWPHNNMENLLIDLVATDIDNPKNVSPSPFRH
jgi:hypothetical protein